MWEGSEEEQMRMRERQSKETHPREDICSVIDITGAPN